MLALPQGAFALFLPLVDLISTQFFRERSVAVHRVGLLVHVDTELEFAFFFFGLCTEHTLPAANCEHSSLTVDEALGQQRHVKVWSFHSLVLSYQVLARSMLLQRVLIRHSRSLGTLETSSTGPALEIPRDIV